MAMLGRHWTEGSRGGGSIFCFFFCPTPWCFGSASCLQGEATAVEWAALGSIAAGPFRYSGSRKGSGRSGLVHCTFVEETSRGSRRASTQNGGTRDVTHDVTVRTKAWMRSWRPAMGFHFFHADPLCTGRRGWIQVITVWRECEPYLRITCAPGLTCAALVPQSSFDCRPQIQ